ncbi:MAG: endolytic transglycosylase MltG [Lachnospiraceae bacterium]|nr:endolytic transglycosylase MltG [Lachnospiraceae bacterium]
MDAKKLMVAVFGAIFRVAAALIVIFCIYSAATYCYDYGYRIFTEPAVALGEGREVKVTVTEDMSPLKIGELFEQEGLVRDGRLFAIQYLLSEYREDVRSGTFQLNTNMTAEDMMKVMAEKTESVQDTSKAPVSEVIDEIKEADEREETGEE